MTRVLAIFLKEILEFNRTEIVNILDRIPKLYAYTEKNSEYATLMELHKSSHTPGINLEVWVSPDYHFMFSDSVVQGGSLSHDLFRYGLFILESLSTKEYSYDDFIASRPSYINTIKEFKIDTKLDSILKKFLKSEDDVYTPQQCMSSTEPCVAVLTTYRNDTRFFANHTDFFKLKFKIYYLGERLPEAVRILSNSGPSRAKFLVFHWTPSEIIDGSIRYKPVQMPSCELYKNENFACRYDLIPVTVYFNEKVKESDDLIDILKRLNFESLKSLLKLYEEEERNIENIQLYQKSTNLALRSDKTIEDYYNQISCKWLQENKHVYTVGEAGSWIRQPTETREIAIGGM